jgi:hypothetical protein
MKKPTRKKFLFLFLALGAGMGVKTALWAQDAAAIVEKSRNRIQAATVRSQSRFVVTAKNGAERVLTLVQFSKDDAGGNSRKVIVFQKPSPDTIVGARFLSLELAGGGTEQKICSKETNGNVRKLAVSDGSKSFMTTDFSNDDISSQDRATSLDTHTLVGEAKAGGVDCYVIESVPKDKGYQYGTMRQYIGKEDSVTYKIELFDQKGVQVKTLETLELKEIQGRLTAVKTRMSTLKTGTSTTLSVDNIRYDEDIPEGVFSDYFLRYGRIQ